MLIQQSFKLATNTLYLSVPVLLELGNIINYIYLGTRVQRSRPGKCKLKEKFISQLHTKFSVKFEFTPEQF